MASGIARGRERTTRTRTATESRNMAAILQILGWQRHCSSQFSVSTLTTPLSPLPLLFFFGVCTGANIFRSPPFLGNRESSTARDLIHLTHIITNYIEIFSQVLLYIVPYHSYRDQKKKYMDQKWNLYVHVLYFPAFKTNNGNPYWPNCIWTLFWSLFWSFLLLLQYAIASCKEWLHHLLLFYFSPISVCSWNDSTLNSNMHILCGCESLYAVHFSYEKQKIGSSINEFCFGYGMLMFWFQYNLGKPPARPA